MYNIWLTIESLIIVQHYKYLLLWPAKVIYLLQKSELIVYTPTRSNFALSSVDN